MIVILKQPNGNAGALTAILDRHYDGDVVAISIDNEGSASEYVERAALAVFAPGVCSQETAEIGAGLMGEFQSRYIPIYCIGAAQIIFAQSYGISLLASDNCLAGREEQMVHDQKSVFSGLQSPLSVIRYDTVCLKEEDLPSEFEISAHSLNGEILGLRSKTAPIEISVFHPQSKSTERGEDILVNVLNTHLKRGEA
jgi:para-aminobenzoate synthetase component 2